MAIYSPYLFACKLVEYPEGLVCLLLWKDAFGESSSYDNYFGPVIVVLIFIPFVVIAILYIIIYTKLKSQKNPGEHSANAGKQRQQREQNVLKMTIAIVLGFAVCSLPFGISCFFVFFAPDTWSCGFLHFLDVVAFTTKANCAINPCICFIFSRNYREGLKTLFRKKSFKQRRN